MRVFTSNVRYCKTMKQYNKLIAQIKYNISKIVPEDAIRILSKYHLDKTNDIIEHARISNEAKSALIMHIEYSDVNNKVINVHSKSEVGGIFEGGVVPHMVNYNFLDVSGNPVAEWIENHGLPNGYFIAGGPDSTIKKPGIRFMELGFNEAVKRSGPTVTLLLNTKV